MAVAQGLGVVGTLASVKLSTIYLGPADYGRFAAALAVAGIVQLCLYGAISQAASRFLFLANFRGSLDFYLRALAVLTAFATAIVLVIWWLSDMCELSTWLPVSNWLLFFLLVVGGSQQVLLAVLNAGRARRSVALVQAVEAVGRPIVIFAASSWFLPTPTVVLGAYTISAAIVVAVLLIALRRLHDSLFVTGMGASEESPPKEAHSLTLQMLGYALPFVLFGIVGALGSHGERLLLTAWISWEKVGIYALMSQVAVTPTVLLTNLINQFYLPVIFHRDPKGTADFGPSLQRYLLLSAVGTAILVVAIVIIGPFLIALLSSKEFLGHEYLLGLLVISAGLFGMAQQMVLPGLRALQSSIYILPKFMHSAALLATASLLVPTYGLDGMAGSSILAAALYVVLIAIVNGRKKVRG